MPEPEAQQTAAPAAETPAPPAEQPKPLSPFLEAIKRPIPGDNPCGKDVTYDDAFQKIKTEIDRIGSASVKIDQEQAIAAAKTVKETSAKQLREMEKKGQALDTKSIASDTGGIDYPMIVELATKILSEKSKDLRVAGYLCFALWRTQRFAGLAEGLMAIHILLQEFWDGLFPAKTRMAARKGAIEFLTQKLPEALDAAEVAADDHEHLESAKQTLTELQNAVTAKIPQSDFLLMGMIQAVGKCLAKVPKPAPAVKKEEQDKKEGDDKEAGPSSQPSSIPIGKISSQQTAFDAIRDATKFLRGQERKSAAPYRLLRSMKWDVLVAEPPNTGGKTAYNGPNPKRREYFIKLQQNGEWDKLLDEGEADFMQPHIYFWLDLQRLIVAALEALGSEYQHARMAILQELAILLQRVPRLPNLTFSDGSPLADPATQSWIEETVMPVLGSGEGAAVGPAAPPLDSDLAALFAEAKKILAKGDLAAAIAYLQDGATLDVSGKNRFRRRLHIATVCLRGGQPKMARPLLEDLSEEIEKFGITVWEPALALEVWKNLYECYGSLTASAPPAGKAGLQEHADRVFEKMCRLDLSYALAATGTKPKTKRPAPPKPTKRTADEMEEQTTDEMDSREQATADEKDEPGASTDGKVKRGKKAAASAEEKGKREPAPAAAG